MADREAGAGSFCDEGWAESWAADFELLLAAAGLNYNNNGEQKKRYFRGHDAMKGSRKFF